jgi:ABC-2 type transport system permease protein
LGPGGYPIPAAASLAALGASHPTTFPDFDRTAKVTTLEQKPISTHAAGASAGRTDVLPLRPHVIRAVFQRNFLSYFSNPAGYVFITLFVFVGSGVAFYQPAFFTNNLANLTTLNDWMPYLLLFFIPAITMSIWAEERKQGTDELLFTLPAYDLEIVLGKYLAALGIYSVALGFALSYVVILFTLGEPDLGVVFATYLGYWLMGAMMIAVGMVASLLSSNVTVAFILGALFSLPPVFLGLFSTPLGPALHRQFEELSIPSQFHDFGIGVISLSGVVYFVSLTIGMLYINMVLVGRRHWAGGDRSWDRGFHALVRVAALLVALASFNVLVSRTGARADVTAERLNTLTPQSIALIKQIPKDRPVYIQAYYSPEVPREFVETKTDLINLLREYGARGGDRVRLNLVPTELYSSEARDAEKRFGIEPRQVMTTDSARQESAEIFLGVAFTSGLEEVVIPFFDRGLPIEYELTRSIRVVSRSNRKKIGILNTDAKLMGGFDMRSMGQNPEWSIVTELKKQYDVDSVAPDVAIASDVDVLLVAQPSSLTQPQIDNLSAYIRKGGPTLLLFDPLPVENPQNSPEVPKQPPGGMFGGGPPPEPKGDLRPMLDMLGIDWPTTDIVWNAYNPHPQLANLPPEVVFIHAGRGGAEDAFNQKQAATKGLQEVVMLFPGLLRAKGASPDFTPLLRTNDTGGTIGWSEATQQSFMGISGINPNRRHFPTGAAYTVAARVQGPPATEPAKPEAAKKEGDKEKKDEAKKPDLHVIAIADLDLISEQFFELRRRKIENLELDNVTFILNCIDVLAGDEAFIPLRTHRLKHRTLERLEAQTKNFIEERQTQTKEAEDAAKQQLDVEQKNLDKQVDTIRARKDVDERTKEIMLMNIQEVANRRLEVKKTSIEDQKRKKILESKGDTEQKIRGIQNTIRAEAILVPPVPPLVLGLIVFFVRMKRENEGANPNRLA